MDVSAIVERTLRGVADCAQADAYLPTEAQVDFLCARVTALLSAEPILLRLDGAFVVAGDIHGNASDLTAFFRIHGYPPATRYLFLGDYVDRGRRSIEVLTLLYGIKALHPGALFLLRGNHETASMSHGYGFESECRRRASRAVYAAFAATFRHLPVACVLNGTALCVHGGISPRLRALADLARLAKSADVPDGSVVADLLWSDPSDALRGWGPGARGIGCQFGADALRAFLAENGLALLIRAHQHSQRGFGWAFEDARFGGSCLTVFSSTNYCGLGNFAAVAVVGADNEVKLTILDPLEEGEKPVVIFPEWLLRNSKAEWVQDGEDGPASEPNLIGGDEPGLGRRPAVDPDAFLLSLAAKAPRRCPLHFARGSSLMPRLSMN
jgi:diadenosine tetraphosphatase ApaH/serine/threonine PP2A family protein phosphatase